MIEFYTNLPDYVWMHPITLLFVAWFGACWGSFLNVCIYRIPKKMSVVHPGSHCFACGKPVRWYDNVPIFSWFILKGKCRDCGEPFSMRYSIIELITALLFVAIWLVEGGPSWRVLCYWLFTFGLLFGSGVDLDEFWIPDRVTIGGNLIGVALSLLFPSLHQADNLLASLQISVIGAALGFYFLWMVGELGTLALKKDAMGFGDVKLMGAIGAFLGPWSLLYVLFVASLIGAVVGVTLILMKKSELGGKIPFGPYLSGAALTWILGGQDVAFAYLDFVSGGAL